MCVYMCVYVYVYVCMCVWGHGEILLAVHHIIKQTFCMRINHSMKILTILLLPRTAYCCMTEPCNSNHESPRGGGPMRTLNAITYLNLYQHHKSPGGCRQTTFHNYITLTGIFQVLSTYNV